MTWYVNSTLLLWRYEVKVFKSNPFEGEEEPENDVGLHEDTEGELDED
jgi:hypothetical protein